MIRGDAQRSTEVYERTQMQLEARTSDLEKLLAKKQELSTRLQETQASLTASLKKASEQLERAHRLDKKLTVTRSKYEESVINAFGVVCA